MKLPLSKASTRPSPPDFIRDRLDAALGALAAVEPRPGIEARIMARLDAEPSRRSSDSAPMPGHPGSLAPVAIAASIAFILAGGLLMQHETPAAQGAAARLQQNLPQASGLSGVSAASAEDARAASGASSHAMLTASARQAPTPGLLSGGRRGRATHRTK